jgi:hypothetical protein
MAEKLSRIVLLETALAGLVERIAVIERMLGGPPTDKPVVAGCDGDRRLSKKELAQRWGRSPRTIDRMRARPDFPVPDIVNQQCGWWLSTIQQYELTSQTGGEALDHSGHLRAAEQQKESKAEGVRTRIVRTQIASGGRTQIRTVRNRGETAAD